MPCHMGAGWETLPNCNSALRQIYCKQATLLGLGIFVGRAIHQSSLVGSRGCARGSTKQASCPPSCPPPRRQLSAVVGRLHNTWHSARESASYRVSLQGNGDGSVRLRFTWQPTSRHGLVTRSLICLSSRWGTPRDTGIARDIRTQHVLL